MAYNQNIPQATDQISISQSQILANFQALNGIASNTLAYLLLGPVQGSKPTVSAQMALYTKTSPDTTLQEMYIERADGTEVEFTARGTSNVDASGTSGWTITPSGLLIKWGTKAANAASVTVTPTITSGGPNFSAAPFIAFATPYDTALATFTCGVKSAPLITNGNFTAYCNNFSATTRIFYLVIGLP